MIFDEPVLALAPDRFNSMCIFQPEVGRSGKLLYSSGMYCGFRFG